MKKRIISLLLAAAMLVTLMPAAFAAGTYSDTDGHWGEAAIDRWSSYGVIGGYDGNVFVPDGSMTRAEVARVFVNLLGLERRTDISKYKDVAPSAWYYDDIAKCVAAGILNGDGVAAMNPETPVTREELFTMFARALGVAPKATANKQFIDGNEVSSWAAGYVNALADMGVINGYGGVLSPGSDINRASVMTVLDNAIKTYVTTNGATVDAGDGIVLVVADNVTVTGKVKNLVVADSGKTVTVNGGAVDSVTVVGPQDKVIFTGAAAADTVTIPATAEGASVVVNSAAAVGSVVSEADNVTISGAGKVETAAVSGDNTTVNTDGTDLTVAPGTTGVTENSKPVTGGTTVETEPVKDTTPSTPVTPPVYYPTYYTVNFQYTDGTEISTTSAVAGSAVTAPEVTLTDGQQVKWHNGTDYVELSNLTVNGNMTLTAVVGSDDFTAGDGSEEYPYLISNEAEYKAIGDYCDAAYAAAGSFSAMSLTHFRLIDNITVTTVTSIVPYPDKYPNYVIKYAFNNLYKAELDGDGYTIIPGEGSYAFYNMYYSTVKNVNVVIANSAIVDTCAYINTFDNVDVSGSYEVGGNNGCYTTYVYCDSTLSFNNCSANVDMQGTGGKGDYNAVFIGAAFGQGATLTLNFTNCVNEGTISCGRSAMFIGNPYGPGQDSSSQIIFNITNCSNNGTIRATYLASDYTHNYFESVPYTTHNNTTVVLDSETVSDFLTASNTTLAGTGTIINGPEDATLALNKNENGEFTITAATQEGVAYYKIGMGLYTRYLPGGTNRFYVFSSNITDVNQTISLKYLSFVDATWVANNPDATEGDLDGNKIYTKDEVSYYYVTADTDTLDGVVQAPTIIYISAYDSDGNLLCSASLSN